jgi:hypothetical protein
MLLGVSDICDLRTSPDLCCLCHLLGKSLLVVWFMGDPVCDDKDTCKGQVMWCERGTILSCLLARDFTILDIARGHTGLSNVCTKVTWPFLLRRLNKCLVTGFHALFAHCQESEIISGSPLPKAIPQIILPWAIDWLPQRTWGKVDTLTTLLPLVGPSHVWHRSFQKTWLLSDSSCSSSWMCEVVEVTVLLGLPRLPICTM